MTLVEYLDRGQEIATKVEDAGVAELEQLCSEWRSYRAAFFALAREAEARARLDLINFFEGVSDAMDMAIVRRRKK